MQINVRRLFASVLTLGVIAGGIAGCGEEAGVDSGSGASPFAPGAVQAPRPKFGSMVIANRGSGTISVLDAANGEVLGTYDLPAGANPPEPMYVVHVGRTGAVLVGDRANDRVVEFDDESFAVLRTAPTGAGVFHMWADPVRNSQLWVNNDVDNTTTVIDPQTFEILATVPMPADLVAMGGKPHDVILDPLGKYAYVTMIGVAGPNDFVVQFSTGNYMEVARAAVGKDPHVSLTPRNNLLYVPCQNSNVVIVLNRSNLEMVTEIAVPGAHGAYMTRSGKTFYTSNLPGGGTDALFAIDTSGNVVVGEATDSPYPVPHNIAITTNGQRLFLTHSGGASDKVTFYEISAANPNPVLLGEATVGLNPFGLALVP
ncbi:MAG: YncE family protein [Candidatus Eiseniibacteriota bacterium]|jgi:DNA-binding beta-propeller fold protein YncE